MEHHLRALQVLLCSAAIIMMINTKRFGPPPARSESSQLAATISLSENALTFNFKGAAESNLTAFAAPWILGENRKVLFVELHTWDVYYGPSKYKTGEYYVSATWDYALRKNGFSVYRVSTDHYYERMTSEEILAYHLIFVRDPKWHRLYHQKEIMCKVRPMYYYGDWYYGKNDHNYRFQVPFAEKQVLSAHMDDKNTFMGYFPHNLLDTKLPEKERKKAGLLYGKRPEYFDGHESVINALIDAGFELHSTCNGPDCSMPEGVVRHGTMKPDIYAGLMQQYSFMLGLGFPEGSPSPLIGMSYGVTFLNPLRKGSKVWTQHKAMSRIGFPYTYIVELENTTKVVEAAEWSFRHRFSSYVPPPHRVKSLLHRMRLLLEDDSFCVSSNTSS